MSEVPARTLRVVVADDHPSVRENLRYLLNAELGMVVVGVARDGHDALRLVHATRPDVIVLDSELGDLRGIDVIDSLRREDSLIGIVLYTMDSEACVEGRALGVDACVTKDAPPSMLIDAIKGAAQTVTAPPVQ
ncbi:MAG TPA: response regulator transcription factor [Candidatus Limnocylindria bacterium]|nr:response regulator transcription factor [Candidatus Limnocylindria bacterium]